MKRVLARIFDVVFVLTFVAVIWSLVRQQSTGAEPGSRIDPLYLKTLSGETELLKPNGRPLLVAAVASWCGACKRSNVHLEALFDMGKEAPIDVVVVSVDESMDSLQRAARSWPIRHRILTDHDGSFSRAFRVEALPTYTLLDENGRVIYVHVGPAGASTIRTWLNPK